MTYQAETKAFADRLRKALEAAGAFALVLEVIPASLAKQITSAVGIPTICPMDEHGQYTAEIAPWKGVHVFDANPEVIKELKARGVVVRHDSYNHSYPYCWRCAEPLVYRAVSSRGLSATITCSTRWPSGLRRS